MFFSKKAIATCFILAAAGFGYLADKHITQSIQVAEDAAAQYNYFRHEGVPVYLKRMDNGDYMRVAYERRAVNPEYLTSYKPGDQPFAVIATLYGEGSTYGVMCPVVVDERGVKPDEKEPITIMFARGPEQVEFRKVLSGPVSVRRIDTGAYSPVRNQKEEPTAGDIGAFSRCAEAVQLVQERRPLAFGGGLLTKAGL